MAELNFQRVEDARRNENRTAIARVPSGWVVLGDTQFLRGYSLLIADPIVDSLNAISGPERTRFLDDMAMLGDVIQSVVGAVRMNYSVLGNSLPLLHAHVFPRFDTEPEDAKRRPVWLYPKETREQNAFDIERDAPLMKQIHDGLVSRGLEVTDMAYPWRGHV